MICGNLTTVYRPPFCSTVAVSDRSSMAFFVPITFTTRSISSFFGSINLLRRKDKSESTQSQHENTHGVKFLKCVDYLRFSSPVCYFINHFIFRVIRRDLISPFKIHLSSRTQPILDWPLPFQMAVAIFLCTALHVFL